MKKLKALVTAETIQEDLERSFEGRIEFDYKGYAINHDVLPHDELCRAIKGYDILICEYDTLSKDFFESIDTLKFIICCRGGVRSVIDLDEAMKRGVVVCNNAGRNAGAVTDMVMGYILNMTRNIMRTNALIHTKKLVAEISTKPKEYQDTVWGLDNESPFIQYRGKSVNHMTLGIFGFGNAGKQLARKAHAFGTKILAYDPYADFSDKPDYVENVKWEQIITESDIISVHCALTPQTRDSFSKSVFELMKDGAYFINTSRGELVVEEDLVEALKSGKLSGAAIDVTRKEPIPESSVLINAPNLIITPHIAGSSYDVQYCGTQMIIDSLNDYLQGRKPKNCVVYR